MDNNRLYNRRKELGLTLEEVGKIVGVSKSTVRKWETGYIENMKRDKIALLAKALEVSPLFIMGIEESSKDSGQESITKEEQDHIHKYRSLDGKGKHTVDTVLEMEYNRCNKPHLIPAAAHNDYADDEEQQRLMQEDLDEL